MRDEDLRSSNVDAGRLVSEPDRRTRFPTPELKRFLPSVRSPIFWRIARVVFVCIVVIEAVLLFFSWFSERDRLLDRVDDSLTMLTPLLARADGIAELDRMLAGESLHTRPVLLGYVWRGTNGAERSVGDTVGLGLADSARGTFDSARGHYDRRLSEPSGDGTGSARLWLRVDAEHVNAELRRYVLKILGLVLLISGFVTVGCLLALTPILIRPLQQLDQLMRTGQRRGLRHVVTPSEATGRSDELGNVYRSFERLRNELVASADENARITERFQHFADLGADSFWEVDGRLRFTYVAGDFAGMFGIEAERMIGRSVRRCVPLMKSVVRDVDGLFADLRTEGVWEGVLEREEEEGAVRTIRIAASPLVDECGALLGVRGTVVDVSVASELARELRHQASHDALTGLYNRREFDRLLESELSAHERSREPLCVCMLDLDRFKVVNDNCGHSAGDVLLRQLSELLVATVHERDLVARFGGDEFTLLLPGRDLADGVRIAEALRGAVETYRFHWNDEVYDVGASIGVAEASPALCSRESIVLAADTCCLKAKRLGRNRVQAYNPGDETVVRHHGEMQWMARIGQALEEDRLVLYQQPIVPVGGGSDDEIHFEILLRMTDRDGTVYSPAEFLPAAERYGLIDRIDRWVVSHVILWLARQSIDARTALCVNVNLSAMTVSDKSFQTFLYDRVKAGNVDAGHLCFEITESAAMKDAGVTVEFLDGMRELGCRIALDDFGTGFSSLGQIRKLPVDYIKIDGVFVKNIVDNPLDQALVRSVAEVAGILDVKTVAEFVEDEATLAVLRRLGIDYAQGYLFARPEPLVDLPATASGRFAA